jgi:hypothetical protein
VSSDRLGAERGRAPDGPRPDHQTPFADWALVALAGHALALILTGVAGVAAWATTAVLACLALTLRDPAAAATTAPQEPPANPPDPAAVAPLTPRPLWAQTGRDGPPLPPARR